VGEESQSCKSRNLFVKMDADFILSDPRCSMLSDVEFRIYCQLCALALKARRELLPVRYTPEATAFTLRRNCEQLELVVSRLCQGCDPLLTIEGGRLRVCGLMVRHDGRFIWKEETENGASVATQGLWTSRNNCQQMLTDTPHLVIEAADVDVELDVDVDVVDPKKEAPQAPPSPALAGQSDVGAYAIDLTAKVASEWSGKERFRSQKKLDDFIRKWSVDNPDLMLAHVYEVDKADMANKKAALLKRLDPTPTKAGVLWPNAWALKKAKAALWPDTGARGGGPTKVAM